MGCKYVQKIVFSNYLHKDYEFYSNAYIGSLGAQAIRLREAFNEYNQLVVLNIPRQLTVVVAGIIIIGVQSALLAAVTLVCMALVLSFTIASSRWRLKYRRVLSEANSEIAGIIGDALSHGTTVKSFASEGYEKELMTHAFQPWGKAQYQSWMSSIPADAGRTILAGITMAILLVLTANLYHNNKISIAIVALVQLYVIKMITATQEIAEIIKSYEATMGGAYKSVVTMLAEPTIVDKPRPHKLPTSRTLPISFESVIFQYHDATSTVSAVTDFSLNIISGEKVGLVGYSGSGKTTLTKLLLRFMDVNSGAIRVGGLDVRDVSQRELRERIAYVPQEPLLFHRSIADNIAYGKPSASMRAIREVAQTAYVDEFVSDLPDGYDTLVGERGVKLSGGQRQRVAIARALLKNAPILVLDEATSALDSRSEQYIQKALWELMEGRTALVIAHRLSTIQRMDRIVVMDKGRIVQIGTHAELLKSEQGVYAKLWAHQSGGYIGIPSDQIVLQK